MIVRCRAKCGGGRGKQGIHKLLLVSTPARILVHLSGKGFFVDRDPTPSWELSAGSLLPLRHRPHWLLRLSEWDCLHFKATASGSDSNEQLIYRQLITAPRRSEAIPDPSGVSPSPQLLVV
jgi:hypothetical protein